MRALIGALFATAVLRSVAHAGHSYANSLAKERALCALRSRLVAHMLSMEHAWFDEPSCVRSPRQMTVTHRDRDSFRGASLTMPCRVIISRFDELRTGEVGSMSSEVMTRVA